MLVTYKYLPTQEQIQLWENKLRLLLAKLISGEIALIEFGQAEKKLSDVFTRIRIRATNVDQPHFTVALVHVFYGEQENITCTPDYIEELIQAVMAEVKRWTEGRAKVGEKYLVDINEGLDFEGFGGDAYAQVADI
jgi:hypothetical protein